MTNADSHDAESSPRMLALAFDQKASTVFCITCTAGCPPGGGDNSRPDVNHNVLCNSSILCSFSLKM